MNKISIKTKGISGDVELPAGDYVVSVSTERSALLLVGGGKNYLIPAINRKSAASERAKKTTLQFYSMGGDNWTVAMTIPKRGEWVAYIQLDKKNY